MRRERVAAVAATVAYSIVLLAIWSLIENVNDYAGIVAGARALLAHTSPYDPATWPTEYQRLGTQPPDTAVFGYPGWIAVAFLPLAVLPIPIGSLVWNAGTFVLALLAIRGLASRIGAPIVPSLLVAGVSWPAFLVFLQGQWAYLLLALAVALFVDLERRNDTRAGVWWGVAVLAKPQLFILGSVALAVFCLREQRWKVLAAAAVVVLVAFSVSALVLPDWWTPWLGAVASRRLVRSTQQPTFAGLAGDVAGSAWPLAWGALIALLAIAVLWSVRRANAERGAVAFAGMLAISVGGALYSWSYDHYLVVVTGVVALGIAARLPLRERRGVGVATAVLFGPLALGCWLVAFVRYHDTASGLVPVLAIVLLVTAVALRSRATVMTDGQRVASHASPERARAP